MVSCRIPWRGKQKYRVTNVGMNAQLPLIIALSTRAVIGQFSGLYSTVLPANI